jgi:hypothetical protein
MNNAPISITGIDVVAVAGLRCRRGAHRCRGDRAEEGPVRQDEEGVVQAASGVGAVASVALLLLRLRHRRCRRRRRR